MRMRTLGIAAATVLLSACQQPENVSRLEFERLQTRLVQVEIKVSELESGLAKAKVVAETAAEKTTNAVGGQTPPVRSNVDRYQLVGTSFQNQQTFRYTSKAGCEAAKQTLLEDWKREDDLGRQKGIIYRSRPTPSCLPI